MVFRSAKNILSFCGSEVILLYDEEEGKWVQVFVKAENSLFVKRSLHVEELLDFSIEAYKKFIEDYVISDVFSDIQEKIKIVNRYIEKLKECKQKLEEELYRYE